MRPESVFSSGYGRVLTALTAVAAVVAVAGLAGSVAVRDLVLGAALAGLAVLAVWALFARPAVEVSDGEIVIRNVLRTVRIPWPTVEGADVRWNLVVRTTSGEWTAWAAPRSSDTARPLRRGRQGPAEAAADAIDERLTELRAAGHLDGARETAREHGIRPTVTWHAGTLLAAAGLVVVAAVSRVL
ncbi:MULTISPECIES: PH domain-containing protein [unclassified Actinotalea]|uniref:PH domain-containing protein n=1 Tax=unclassified Actinotalea TaxID=2638618 RepID=UPI0015F511B7|nr:MULTISPECIES: PH domain-containing protein [unclassified Actinotalea]